jgi:hypothetical protein
MHTSLFFGLIFSKKVLSLRQIKMININTMNTILKNQLHVLLYMFKIIILIERDDGKKKQTLEN